MCFLVDGQALPLALSGMQILEAGMKKIRLKPSLIGLERAQVQIPTPYGMITLRQEKGKATEVDFPEEITLEMESGENP